MSMRPALVVHADWSTAPGKRWMSVASLSPGGFVLDAPELVGDTTSLLPRLCARAHGGPCLIGFDFPIGVPVAYAERAGITSFIDELPRFGAGRWPRFYEPAESRGEISIERPFYPRVPGGTSQADLVDRLGVVSMDDLYRACERGSPSRPRACSLLWILGANQVGRGAISGWREVIVPALQRDDLRVAVWPFHGALESLLADSDVVLAETYPAEAYRVVGLPRSGWSKRRQADRRSLADSLRTWAAERPDVVISPELRSAIDDGFSAEASGEDRFDAVLGLMSMVDVVLGRLGEGPGTSVAGLEVEGWILGQQGEQ